MLWSTTSGTLNQKGKRTVCLILVVVVRLFAVNGYVLCDLKRALAVVRMGVDELDGCGLVPDDIPSARGCALGRPFDNTPIGAY